MRIRLRSALSESALPHWQNLLTDRHLEHDRFLPAVDRAFDRFGLSFLATQEYQPHTQDWHPDELAAGLNRVYRLILTDRSRIPAELIRALKLLPEVEDAAAGQIGEMPLQPRTESLSRGTDSASRAAIYLDEAQAYTQGSSDVTIAVLDTGIALNHPELEQALIPGFDFVNILDGAQTFIGDYLQIDADADDEVGHGTHVAGIIAGTGISMPKGVAPQCRIMPVRVLAAMSRDGRRVGAGLVENINVGVKYAIDQGADIINMSLGVRHAGGGLPHQEVIEYAQRKGVTIVAASGNDGQEQLYYPGAFQSVIAVGAMDSAGNVADFSTFGDQVSFVAPGVDVYSTSLDSGYAFSTGTSHAAPFVSGVSALLKSYARERGKSLSDKAIKHILKHSSDKVDQYFKHRKAGYGRLNAADALRYLEFILSQGRQEHGKDRRTEESREYHGRQRQQLGAHEYN